MIPNLALIIATYVLIRLGTMALRQFPRAAKHDIAKVAVVFACVVGGLLVVACTLDIIGIGVSVGSQIELRRGTARPY